MGKNHCKRFSVRGALTFFSVLLVCVAVSGCFAPGPSAVAEKYFEALAKGDMEMVGKHATPETIASVGPLISKVQPMAVALGKVKAVSHTIDGDNAVVVMKAENEEDTQEVQLKKVDGKWRVHDPLDSSSGK